MKRLALIAALLTAGPALAEPARVISLGGAVTEIVAALGAQDRLVARDTTSQYPATITELPDVGYVRALSAEGVLALDPDLILAEATAGPPEAVETLKAAGVDFVALPGDPSVQGVREKIAVVGAALGRVEAAERLTASFDKEMNAVRKSAGAVDTPKRVLFVLSLQNGRVMAGGEGSSAEAIIELAGGVNAATGFAGYKPVTDEAILAADPDVILTMDREGEMAVTERDILAHPALGQTRAAQGGALVAMDGMLLLGFGPRTPQAAQALHAALYPEAEG
ncbi:iron complex transport system substrate-binding protein [Thioclava sp. ES.031]|uniref:heme/hemin ABC transporter substrate-binding protein n=1 Tax=Thioclava sp. ES.031 TaxID=1798203 RepID=UPI000BF6A1D3|nr:hemin ABC transporter substrate-binding protein [Thioclava sp. ES.031]PFG63922.1 iron complex transport system substrate-binding protein [Thioclava sp. ES.031]